MNAERGLESVFASKPTVDTHGHVPRITHESRLWLLSLKRPVPARMPWMSIIHTLPVQRNSWDFRRLVYPVALTCASSNVLAVIRKLENEPPFTFGSMGCSRNCYLRDGVTSPVHNFA